VDGEGDPAPARAKYGFETFREITKTPHWVQLPRFVTGGGRWDDGPRRDNFAEADAAEDRSNRRLASDAKARILAFLDGLATAASATTDGLATPLASVLELLDRFDAVVAHLGKRRAGRHAVRIDDEYDVQYVLGAALRGLFDDVREEEWTPSYAGGCARMDFLLKREQLVIETKMTRAGLDAKKIGDELAADIVRYQTHADCKTLVCFIYDPDRRVANPRGFERDLTQAVNAMSVVTRVRPR
jgi:hypothetical protein